MSEQKLRLLKMSLDHRLQEYPHLVEVPKEEDGIPAIPRSAQVTGTLVIKMLGVEGILDLAALRSQGFLDFTSPHHRPSTSSFISHLMTLPRPHRANTTSFSNDLERKEDKEGPECSPPAEKSSTLHWPRRGSRSRKGMLTKQSSSQEFLDDSFQSKPLLFPCVCLTTPSSHRL